MQDLYPRPHSPFDSGAADRQRRMGLLDAGGQPDREAMLILSHVFAGQLYDDLSDYYQDAETVRELLSQLFSASEPASPHQKFLLICLQYDAMFRDLPDPIWWISGNPTLSELFADGFLAHLRQLEKITSEGGPL